MDVNKYKVGQRIKFIRQSHNLTMNDFGKVIDAPKSAVNNWEKGRNLPNKERINKIAKLGNTTTNFILYGSLRDFTFKLLSSYIWGKIDMYEDVKQVIWEYTTKIQTNVKELLISIDMGLITNLDNSKVTNEQADETYKNIKMNAIYKTIKFSIDDLMELVNYKGSYNIAKILNISNDFFKSKLKYIDNTFKGKVSLLNDASTRVLDTTSSIHTSAKTFESAMSEISKDDFMYNWTFREKLDAYFSAKLLDLVIDFHDNVAKIDNEYNQTLREHDKEKD